MIWLTAAGSTQAPTEVQDYSLTIPLGGIAACTLVYLLIDIYLSTGTFRAIFGTAAFWLLYLAFCALGLISYGALQVAAGQKIVEFVGHPQIAAILHTILAVGGALTVIQSLTVKLGDMKVVDLGEFVDRFRSKVKAQIVQRATQCQSTDNLRLIDRMARDFDHAPEALVGPLSTKLSQAGMNAAAAATEINGIRSHCQTVPIPLARGFAERLALMDADYAKGLTPPPRPS